MPTEDPGLEGDEEKGDGDEDSATNIRLSAMVKVFHFVMKQSYICALIAMMVSTATWSVTQPLFAKILKTNTWW